MSTKQIKRLPWILVTLGPLILFGPMLMRAEALFWGTPLLQFVPWRQFALNSVRQGHLPWWNPMLGMGAPLLANYQSALLYPPNILLILTGVAWGHGLLMVLHLIWAGYGMIVVARNLRLGPLAQAVAGLSFSLSGYLVARGGFLSINAAAAWLPWIVVAVDRMAKQTAGQVWSKSAVKAVLWLSLAFSLQWLAGHAQTAWYTLLLACFWGGWRAIELKGWKRLWRTGAGLIGAGVLAFTMSAVQLLPTVEYLAQSHRAAALDPEFVLTYSFWPWRLLGLLVPDLFGNPATGNYWGYGNYWEDAIYIGVLPLLLALGAIWRSFRDQGEHSRLSRLLVVLSTVALVFALGKNSPIFPILFQHVPSFDLFQAPTRWNLILVFSLSLLAAIGAENWREPSGRSLYWTRLGTVGAGVVGLAAWLGSSLIEGVEPSFVRAFVFAGLWMFITGVLTLRGSTRSSWIWISLSGLVILIDLVVAGIGLNPTVPIEVFQGESQLVEVVGNEHRIYMAPDVEYEFKYERTHRFDTFYAVLDWSNIRDSGLPNTPLLDGISSANNFDPILPDRYVIWVEAVEALPDVQRMKLLALMDVGWQASIDPSEDIGLNYEPIPGASRLRMIPQAIVASSPEAALSLVTAPDFEPTQTVVLEGVFQQPLPIGSGEGKALFNQTLDPGVVLVTVHAPEGTWLLLSDTWYPGWEAMVDDVSTTLYRADYLFRAVWVPPGEHQVEFGYRPALFTVGGFLSLAAWLSLSIVGWRLWRD